MAIFAGTHFLLQLFAGAQDSRNLSLLFFLGLHLLFLLVIPIIIHLLLQLGENLPHRLMLDLNLSAARLNLVHARASLSQPLYLHCLIHLFINADVARFIPTPANRHDVGADLLLQGLVFVVGGTSVPGVVDIGAAVEFVLATDCILNWEVCLKELVI